MTDLGKVLIQELPGVFRAREIAQRREIPVKSCTQRPSLLLCALLLIAPSKKPYCLFPAEHFESPIRIAIARRPAQS